MIKHPQFILPANGDQHHQFAIDIGKRDMVGDGALFMELDAIAALWPGVGTSKHMEKHVQLRDMYHELWEKKWQDLQNQ